MLSRAPPRLPRQSPFVQRRIARVTASRSPVAYVSMSGVISCRAAFSCSFAKRQA